MHLITIQRTLIFSFLIYLLSWVPCSLRAQLLSNFHNDTTPDLTLIPVMNNGLYGFVDRNNKVVIPAAYENVSFFDQQGYAQARQNGLYGIINKSGQWVVPLLEKNPISYSSMVKNLKNRD